MDWENKLLSTPTDQWVVDQVIAFDWYDGPRSGLCALAQPAADFYFEVEDEELNPDGLDTRIVRLKELPANCVALFATALEQLAPGSRVKPVWCPVWRFPSKDAQIKAETMIASLTSQARSTNLLIATIDMVQITGCWKLGMPLETLR